jgi:hypothetical protein
LYIPRTTNPEEIAMSDATEPYRRQRLAEINAQPGSREALEAQYGQVWTTDELSHDFEVIGYMAPVGRRASKKRRQEGQLGVPTQSEVLFRIQAARGLMPAH